MLYKHKQSATMLYADFCKSDAVFIDLLQPISGLLHSLCFFATWLCLKCYIHLCYTLQILWIRYFFATHSATYERKNVVFDFVLLHRSATTFSEIFFATCDDTCTGKNATHETFLLH